MTIRDRIRRWLGLDDPQPQQQQSAQLADIIAQQTQQYQAMAAAIRDLVDGRSTQPSVAAATTTQPHDTREPRPQPEAGDGTTADLRAEVTRLQAELSAMQEQHERALAAAKMSAVQDWLTQIRTAQRPERRKTPGRPGIEGVKMSILIRQEIHDQLVLIKSIDSRLSIARFLNDAAAERLDRFFQAHPELLSLDEDDGQDPD